MTLRLDEGLDQQVQQLADAQGVSKQQLIVRATQEYVDRQGRMTAEVLLPDGRQIAHELVKEGLAWVRPGGSGDQGLKDMEELARAARKGLWAEPNPVPPWNWTSTKPARQN